MRKSRLHAETPVDGEFLIRRMTAMFPGRKFLLSIAGLVGSLIACVAMAASTTNPAGYPEDMLVMDPREVAMLPHYCIYTYSFREAGVAGSQNQAEFNRWSEIVGPMFKHLHHYCLGIMNTNRALLIAVQQRKFYLARSISEFDYVLHRSPSDFVLVPEILTKKGENLIRLGKTREGVEVLEQSIEIKPDYWPPYAALSDYYKEKGDAKRARELLERGVAVAPDAKGLTMRLKELATNNKQ